METGAGKTILGVLMIGFGADALPPKPLDPTGLFFADLNDKFQLAPHLIWLLLMPS
jgi:hypothetical protein